MCTFGVYRRVYISREYVYPYTTNVYAIEIYYFQRERMFRYVVFIRYCLHTVDSYIRYITTIEKRKTKGGVLGQFRTYSLYFVGGVNIGGMSQPVLQYKLHGLAILLIFQLGGRHFFLILPFTETARWWRERYHTVSV